MFHPRFCNQPTRWTSWIGAPLKVVSCETNKTRGRWVAPLFCARVATVTSFRFRGGNRFRNQRGEFRPEAFDRKILLVGLARFTTASSGQSRRPNQPPD